MISRECIAIVLAGAMLPLESARAQCQLQELAPAQLAPTSAFGWSVAADGERVIVGAYYDSATGVATGAAYVYRLLPNGLLALESRLGASDAAYGDYGGASVAIDGNYAIMGATGHAHHHSTGAAYVFQRQGGAWIEQARLEPPSGHLYHDFGNAVALAGNVAIVGSYKNDHGKLAGGAYAFRREGEAWVFEHHFNTSGASASDVIGRSVAIAGERVLIGAFSTGVFGPAPTLHPAAAYLFRRGAGGQWTAEGTLTSPSAMAPDGFGVSVALDGERAIVGAYRDNARAHEAGSAYIFRRDPSSGLWSQEAQLTCAEPNAHDYFGFSVALAGETAVIGATHVDAGAPDGGAAFVFKRGADGAWTQRAMLIPARAGAGDATGWAVATDGQRAFVAAVAHDEPAQESGAAAVFAIGGGDCDGNGALDACDIAFGAMIDDNVDGLPDDCAPGASGDLTGDGAVDGLDLAALLANWGPCPAPSKCPADLDRSGAVGGLDLAILLATWGAH